MKNLAIFASGNGSNFEALACANLNCNIRVLICNKKDAYVIKRAQKIGIKYEIVESENYSKKDYEKKIIELLQAYEIELIILAGYMKIFSSDFVDKYSNKIINIHPSKLPNYRGLNAVERAFSNNDKEIGVSVHFVDSGVDTGNVIACECINVSDDDTLEDVFKKIHDLEHSLYPKVLRRIL
ncbi:MAG: phosphoribosylglycinamide formyltransferase [Bacilli bacterium]